MAQGKLDTDRNYELWRKDYVHYADHSGCVLWGFMYAFLNALPFVLFGIGLMLFLRKIGWPW